MKNSYLTIKDDFETLTVIEKSKFITYLHHVSSEEEARAFIAKISKKNYDATHNCYAFITDTEGNLSRFSDDGEPSGTAGMPMLESIKNGGVCQIVAVVTRYFGGIKLGAGGLVRAYAGCVSEAIKQVKKVEYTLSKRYVLSLSYDFYNAILKIFNGLPYAKILSQNFNNEIEVEFIVKNEYESTLLDKITETFLGKLTPKFSVEEYGEF